MGQAVSKWMENSRILKMILPLPAWLGCIPAVRYPDLYGRPSRSPKEVPPKVQ